MLESFKALRNETFLLFNLAFANKTIFALFSFFLIIDLYFLIPAVIAKIYNPIAELVISVGIPTKETKAEMVVNIIQNSTTFFMHLTH